MTRRFYVYMLANRNRTLYVGVTRDIVRRMAQHRVGVGSGFTRRYAVTRLVHVESCERPRDAIAREKEIKRWSRQKQIALIEASNPTWTDLATAWFDDAGPSTGTIAIPRSARNDNALYWDRSE
jgi:putative endonuclease